jgi:hypothetical protein
MVMISKLQTRDIICTKSAHLYTSRGGSDTQIRDLIHPVDAVGVQIKLRCPCLADSDALLY